MIKKDTVTFRVIFGKLKSFVTYKLNIEGKKYIQHDKFNAPHPPNTTTTLQKNKKSQEGEKKKKKRWDKYN